MKLYPETLADAEFEAFSTACDLAFRGIRQHPFTQFKRTETAVVPFAEQGMTFIEPPAER